MPLRPAWVTQEDFQKQTNNKTPTSLEGVQFHGFTDDGISASYQEE